MVAFFFEYAIKQWMHIRRGGRQFKSACRWLILKQVMKKVVNAFVFRQAQVKLSAHIITELRSLTTFFTRFHFVQQCF